MTEEVIVVLMMREGDLKDMLDFHNSSKGDTLETIKDLEGTFWMGLGTDEDEPEVEILAVIELTP